MSTDKSITAAVYARVSSELSDVENSIAAQLSECKAYCAKQGWELPEEFVFVEPEAVSARDENRPAFAQMMGLAKTSPPPFQIIVVLNRARFMRHYERAVVYRGMLRRNGVRLASVKEPVDDNPTGRLIEAILDSVNEYQREYLAIETVRGLLQNARDGYSLGSLAYGYRRKIAKMVKRGHLESAKVLWEPEPEEAAVVRRIFDLYVNGYGYKTIATTLNADGIPAPEGGLWFPGTVGDMLQNEAYLGRRIGGRHMDRKSGKRWQHRPREEWVITDGAHEPIVDVATFEKAQAIRMERGEGRRAQTSRSDYLLSGLMTCAKCGSSVWGSSAGRRTADGSKTKYRTYRCRGASAGICRHTTADAPRVERAVLEKVSSALADPAILARVIAVPDEREPAKPERDERRAELAQINRKVTNLLQLAEMEPDPGIIGRLRELRARQSELQAAMAAEVKQARRAVQVQLDLDHLRNIGAAVSSLEASKRKELLGMLIDGITVDLSEKVATMRLLNGPSFTFRMY